MYISEVPQISNVPKPVSSTARGANNIWDFSPAVYIYIQKHIYIYKCRNEGFSNGPHHVCLKIWSEVHDSQLCLCACFTENNSRNNWWLRFPSWIHPDSRLGTEEDRGPFLTEELEIIDGSGTHLATMNVKDSHHAQWLILRQTLLQELWINDVSFFPLQHNWENHWLRHHCFHAFGHFDTLTQYQNDMFMWYTCPPAGS